MIIFLFLLLVGLWLVYGWCLVGVGGGGGGGGLLMSYDEL